VYFIYVYTVADSNVGSGPHPITVSEFDRRSIVNGNLDLVRRLVTDEFEGNLLWEDVMSVEVETEADPDETQPETKVVYTKR
jgi:hypothetical protein